jgi:hypothetical protein
VVNLALVVGHLGLRGNNQPRPGSFREEPNPCHLPRLKIRFPRC